ncbi:alkaline shock protein 23 [Bacillus sp. JCM 19046]|uniref:Alkaline shock protein 23 n=1 Tax=Shouchella xiaoxiensis TaxID=766895 RepID=A0ABS2SPC9_9BACI|nr:Asp23/Gls24 family envelope stress response protein [Shouchella xiaoxiensis]MBM7837379.1 putative alkaline shock family protein YloU [Shouchella xiaoxiensis]GAF13278.1 alkaline shock protein 23 [Bacillus sp. JCM 19045]GAF17037.1 alkaline shock protein 23 [Bacillus sp. JCM 19046]
MDSTTVKSTTKRDETFEAEKRKEAEANANRDKLTYDNEVIKKITAIATIEADGILGMSGSFFSGIRETLGGDEDITKGIRADVGEKQVAIDLEVYIEYGKNIPEIYKSIKSSVAENIKTMTGLELVEFNMNVADVFTRQEFDENNSKTRQTSDRVE